MPRQVAPDVAKPCAGRSELFLERTGEPNDERVARERAAKAVCDGCPVEVDCLDVAIANREAGAVWGGLNDQERARVARRLRRLALA